MKTANVGVQQQRVNKKKLRRQQKRSSCSQTSDINNNRKGTDCNVSSASATNKAQTDDTEVNWAALVYQFFTRAVLGMRGYYPSSYVCLSVCVSVYLSVTRQYCIAMAKRTIT